MTTDETGDLPVRPQQPPPRDVVQQQLRLLVLAMDELRSGISPGPRTALAGELTYQVAELGGWADSLMEVGTHVTDGDHEYVVGEPNETPGR